MQISSKVAVAISVVVAVVGALATTFALRFQEDERRQEYATKSTEMLKLVAVSVAPQVLAEQHSQVQTVLDNVVNYNEFTDVDELEVLSPDGRVIAALDPTRFNEVDDDPVIERTKSLGEPILEQQRGQLTVTVPVRTTHLVGVIRARFNQTRLVASIARQKRNAALFVLATMLLVGLALHLIHRRLVAARLSGLATTAAALGDGDLAIRASAEGNDEIASLGTAFNTMAAAIQDHTDNLERLIEERTEELTHANKQLEKLAITDQLTGLANRRHFDELARRAIEVARRNERPLSVVLVDTDRFKSVNDRFGHPVGDAVLQAVAKVLKSNARKADLVARVGGEEFAVLMPEAGVGLAAQGAERMRAALERDVNRRVAALDGHVVTASFGVASFEKADDRLEDLLSAADEAMYKSKHTGRNRVTTADRSDDIDAPPPSDTKELEGHARS